MSSNVIRMHQKHSRDTSEIRQNVSEEAGIFA